MVQKNCILFLCSLAAKSHFSITLNGSCLSLSCPLLAGLYRLSTANLKTPNPKCSKFQLFESAGMMQAMQILQIKNTQKSEGLEISESWTQAPLTRDTQPMSVSIPCCHHQKVAPVSLSKRAWTDLWLTSWFIVFGLIRQFWLIAHVYLPSQSILQQQWRVKRLKPTSSKSTCQQYVRAWGWFPKVESTLGRVTDLTDERTLPL